MHCPKYIKTDQVLDLYKRLVRGPSRGIRCQGAVRAAQLPREGEEKESGSDLEDLQMLVEKTEQLSSCLYGFAVNRRSDCSWRRG